MKYLYNLVQIAATTYHFSASQPDLPVLLLL